MIKRILTLYGLIIILMLLVPSTTTNHGLFTSEIKAQSYSTENTLDGGCVFCHKHWTECTCGIQVEGKLQCYCSNCCCYHDCDYTCTNDPYNLNFNCYCLDCQEHYDCSLGHNCPYTEPPNNEPPPNDPNYDPTQQPDNPTCDCAGVENGRAFTDSCGVCVGGTTGLFPCVSKTNCEEIKDIFANLSVLSQYNALFLKLLPIYGTTNEWGTVINASFSNLNDWSNYTGSYSVTSPDIEEGGAHSFNPDWADNPSSLTRAIGVMHIHPSDGSCLSPADINPLLSLRNDLHLEERAKEAIVMAITLSTTYSLKIDDWTKFRDFDTSILSGLATRFKERVDQGEDQEEIFLDLYINNPDMKGAFALFKTDSTGKQMSVNTVNGNTTYQPCNN